MTRRRRWLRRSLIALPLVLVTLALGACGSAMYIHVLWESGNHRCGREMEKYSGWGIEFNGRTDAFVCTVDDARGRVVARQEIPVEDLMGRSGSWPLFPDLVAHELESVDLDAP